MFGFESLRDVLDVLFVPLTLATLSLAWPGIQSRFRQRRFRALIFRELSELAPHPPKARADGSWWEHVRTSFVHREIFSRPTENRDFILSLDPDLTYFVSQLWNSYATRDIGQWTYVLCQLSDVRFGHQATMSKVHAKWATLLSAYGVPVADCRNQDGS